jgi:mono/diheme cytochrome c family protein
MLRRLAAAAIAAAALHAAAARAGNDGQDFSQIERGRYLTIAGDCAGCHTNEGGGDFAGGFSVETPFGNVLASNITPDRETGIGSWTDEQFVGALTRGTRRDGAHLYPAMPYPYFTKVTRADALAIRAYLNTVPAVQNKVTADQLPFPFRVRAGMTAWNALYFHRGEFQPVAGKSVEWNRGAYLVEGLMHCAACHTPKNFAGGDKTGEALRGYAVQGWFAPDITGNTRYGLGSWTIDDIVAYLKTGHNRISAATGPMADEVSKSSSRMTDADLHAVAVYLKDRPASKEETPKPLAGSEPAMKQGAAIYADECSACHTPQGAGIKNLIPALAGSASVQARDPTSLMRVVLDGAQSVATGAAPTGPGMPGFAWLLDDEQAAAVLTYIRNSWGNAAPEIAAADIGRERSKLAKRSE